MPFCPSINVRSKSRARERERERSCLGMAALPSTSLKLAFVVSFSLAASSFAFTSPSSLFLFQPRYSSSPANVAKRKSNHKATTSDLLSLLGAPQQSASIDAQIASELRSCFKFLVPFSPIKSSSKSMVSRRVLGSGNRCGRSRREEDEMIWWPPAPVVELARLAVDSGRDPAAIHRALDPTVIPVPAVEGSNKYRCELTRTPYGRRFIHEELNSYLKFLFEVIVARGPGIGLHVSLNRYDFFHGHLFIAFDSGRLGILFHAKEYPAYDDVVFPYNMGFCQIGSNVTYDDTMNLRNILWLAPLPSNSTEAWLAPGVLVVLDAHPGGIIYRDLIPEYVNSARTLYEEDFGDVAVDVNYLNVGRTVPDYQLFIC